MNKILLLLLITFLFARSTFAMNVSIYAEPAVCNDSKGSAFVIVNGGTYPYTYQWSTGSTQSVVFDLAGGTFLTVWVYDSTGDSATSSATIPAQATLNIPSMSWAGSCPCIGQCNGTGHLVLDGIGGFAPYSAWYDGNPMQPVNLPQPSLDANLVCYNATGNIYVTDANGCSVSVTYPPPFVTPDPVIYSISVSGACNGNNGAVEVLDNSDAMGLNRYYNFYDSASNPIQLEYYSNTISSLAAGSYYVELFSITGHFDPYQYTWTANPCAFVSQQFTIPDMSPDCENVSGTIYHDDDLDCSHDGSELLLPGVVLTFTPGPYYAVTNGNGNYSLNLPSGSYTISQSAPFTVYPVCPPANQILDVQSGGQIIDYNFADTTQSALDLASFVSSSVARPGFNFDYHISGNDFSYYNGGECTITFDYDSSLTFVSSSVVPVSQSAGEITWSSSSIGFNSSFYVSVTLHVPSSVPIGTTLSASSSISSVLAESNLSNNTDNISQLTVGSFDPNMKIAMGVGSYSGPQITAAEDLSYTIYFQNTGTDTAFNVEVIDTLSPYLDLSSIFVTHATHDYELDILNPGILKFSFDNILLPDSNVNEPASHGSVNFRIRQVNGNAIGTVINNRAAIVFDFNAPVITNNAWVYICNFDTAMNSLSICEGDSVFAESDWQTQAGIYYDHYSNIYSCDSTVITELSVNSTDASIVQDQNVLTAVLVNASYQWYNCDLSLPIPGATDQSYTATQNGNYGVQITANGCTVMSDCYEVIGTGIESNEKNWYTIHPNPAGDKLFIEFSQSHSVNQLVIQNTLGKIVYTEQLQSDERISKELNVHSLPSGVYMLTISGDGIKSEKLFVKE